MLFVDNYIENMIIGCSTKIIPIYIYYIQTESGTVNRKIVIDVSFYVI